MGFCTQCGNTVKNTDIFCSSCGNKIQQSQEIQNLYTTQTTPQPTSASLKTKLDISLSSKSEIEEVATYYSIALVLYTIFIGVIGFLILKLSEDETTLIGFSLMGILALIAAPLVFLNHLCKGFKGKYKLGRTLDGQIKNYSFWNWWWGLGWRGSLLSYVISFVFFFFYGFFRANQPVIAFLLYIISVAASSYLTMVWCLKKSYGDSKLVLLPININAVASQRRMGEFVNLTVEQKLKRLAENFSINKSIENALRLLEADGLVIKNEALLSSNFKILRQSSVDIMSKEGVIELAENVSIRVLKNQQK
jgi:hypothetical protein